MYKNKSILSWAVYDWANSVFATVVLAGFFPIVFKSYWADELSSSENTFWLGVANALGSLLVVCLAPLMGSVGDKYLIRKPLLLAFMLLGVCSTAMLSATAYGNWQVAMALYVVAMLGFMMANVFYDALLISVGDKKDWDKISGLGYGLGYLGGGLSLFICVYLSQQPQLLSYEESIDVVLLCFLLVSLWWLLFSVPLALWTRDNKQQYEKKSQQPLIKQTLLLFKQVFSQREVRYFLIAYWLYIDGVDTIIRMAVDYGMAIGFESSDLIKALLITQFIGFPAAILYGYLGSYMGVKPALMMAIAAYALITILSYSMQTVADFYLLAALIGLVQGGIQAMSRSMFARMVPEGQAAEYFGIYNMLGKSAAIVGPLLMGAIALLTEDHRLSILSLLILFVLGAFFLNKVKLNETAKE